MTLDLPFLPRSVFPEHRQAQDLVPRNVCADVGMLRSWATMGHSRIILTGQALGLCVLNLEPSPSHPHPRKMPLFAPLVNVFVEISVQWRTKCFSFYLRNITVF